MNTTSWSIQIVKGNDTLTIKPGGWYPGLENFKSLQLKGPAGTRPTGGSDAPINFVQPDDATNIELYAVKYVNSTTLEASMKRTNNIRQSCVGKNPGDFIGTRAYGGSTIAGVIRDWEAKTEIRHPLALAVCWDKLKAGYVWPATSQDNGWRSYSGSIPMGSLFAIPRSVNVESLGLNQYGKKLAYAAQRYGAIIADQGCGPAFYGEPKLTPSIATAIRSDTLKVLRQLVAVTNNTKSTPGGRHPDCSEGTPVLCSIGYGTVAAHHSGVIAEHVPKRTLRPQPWVPTRWCGRGGTERFPPFRSSAFSRVRSVLSGNDPYFRNCEILLQKLIKAYPSASGPAKCSDKRGVG